MYIYLLDNVWQLKKGFNGEWTQSWNESKNAKRIEISLKNNKNMNKIEKH